MDDGQTIFRRHSAILGMPEGRRNLKPDVGVTFEIEGHEGRRTALKVSLV